MDFSDNHHLEEFNRMWRSVKIVRSTPYTLFTFGSSELKYYLVESPSETEQLVTVRRGQVDVTRPILITPYNSGPEFQNFFEDGEQAGMVDFLLSRSAAFKNMKFHNQEQRKELTSDSVEEVVHRLTKELDTEDEDRIAILTAEHGLGSIAVFRFTLEKILESANGNVRELQEHGFLR